jgi:hypothetical protein
MQNLENEVNWKPEVIEIAPPLVSKELKKRWSHFIRFGEKQERRH